MSDSKNQLANLFSACWNDKELKARFFANPKAVMTERGMAIPAGMNVKVVENAENCMHITMPAAPVGHSALTDLELSADPPLECWSRPATATYCAAHC
jgi:hypothetical protein